MIETEYGTYPKTIYTHFGKASIEKGYYRITTKKEGNQGKRLHKLIYEKYNGPVPKGYHIHHKDGNSLNNNLNNLQCLTENEHHSLHKSGENSYWYGKKRPEHSEIMTGENNPQAKINKVGAACIKILLKYTDLTHQEIADSIPNATKAIVDQISSGSRWSDITIYDFKN
jgi:hypothetical protein